MNKVYKQLQDLRYSQGFYCRVINAAYPIVFFFSKNDNIPINELMQDMLSNLYRDRKFAALKRKMDYLQVDSTIKVEECYVICIMLLWIRQGKINVPQYLDLSKLTDMQFNCTLNTIKYIFMDKVFFKVAEDAIVLSHKDHIVFYRYFAIRRLEEFIDSKLIPDIIKGLLAFVNTHGLMPAKEEMENTLVVLNNHYAIYLAHGGKNPLPVKVEASI